MKHVTQVLVSLSIGLPLFVWSIANGGTRTAVAATIVQADPNASLPDGPGKSVVIATCTKCHAITNITGVHKDRDSWAETVSKMVGYGATASDDDLQTILDYLTKYYGPEAPPSGSAAVAHAKKIRLAAASVCCN
jgi:competence protein ComEA